MKYLVHIIIVSIVTSTLGLSQYNKDLTPEAFKKWRGNILFSDNEVSLDKLDDETLKNGFKLYDDIYATFILDKTLAKAYQDNNYQYNFEDLDYDYNYAIRLKVNNNSMAQWLYEMPEPLFENTLTFNLPIITSNKFEKREHSDFINDIVAVIASLDEGKQTITFDIVPLYKDNVGNELPVLAAGSFSLNIDKNNLSDFYNEKTTSLPVATLDNNELESDIVSASREIYPYAKPQSAYITDKEAGWSYSSDENGNVLSRNIIASVLYVFTSTEKCWVKTGIYSQKHYGNGQFSETQYFKATNGYYDYQVPCAKVSDDLVNQ